MRAVKQNSDCWLGLHRLSAGIRNNGLVFRSLCHCGYYKTSRQNNSPQMKELITRERAGGVMSVSRVGVCARSSQTEAVFCLHSAKVCPASGSQGPTETCHIQKSWTFSSFLNVFFLDWLYANHYFYVTFAPRSTAASDWISIIDYTLVCLWSSIDYSLLLMSPSINFSWRTNKDGLLKLGIIIN